MSVNRWVLLFCDNCGDCTDPEPTAALAVKAAREYGWDCTDGGHLCEDCVDIIDGEAPDDE